MSVRKSGSRAVSCEPVLKLRGVLFVPKRPDGVTTEHTLPRSATEEQRSQRPFPRKPCGRRVFFLGPALARPLQPTAGMLLPRPPGRIQNPSPQDLTQF